MLTLYVLSGPQIGKTFELVDGSVLGRAPTCASELAVALRDSSVSRNHARIEREGTNWFITDLGSSNGVQFGGSRVQRHELADQVEFKLGELELRVRVETAPKPASPKPAAPKPAAPKPAAPKPAAPKPAAPKPAAPKPAAPKPAVLQFFEDEDEIELEEEIELELDSEPTQPTPAPKSTAPVSPPAAPARSQSRTTQPASPGDPVMKRKVLQYNRVENRGGLFTTEMSQWPPLVQFLMLIFAVAIVGGLGYGAYLAAQIIRGG